ncbi:MAG: C40 family peptidase [Steroidobacteraceae bacterium]
MKAPPAARLGCAMNVRQALAVFLIAFIAGGCASVPRHPAPSDEKREPVGILRPSHEDGAGEKLVQIASGLIGTPYRYGGEDPRGFDCSGLVFYSFDKLGIGVPRTAQEQRRAARGVKREALTAGDLVFFRTSARRVNHVGIYAGDGKFIHAPRSGKVVSYAYLDDPYYRQHFVSAGRLQ